MGNEEDERSAAGRGRIREVLDSVQSEVTISRVWDESPSVSSRGFQPRTQSLFFAESSLSDSRAPRRFLTLASSCATTYS